MTRNWRVSRRTILRGLGASVALPLLDIMEPVAAAARVGGSSGAPRRLACIFQPNGVYPKNWDPTGEGAGYELSPILEPLACVKSDVSVLSNLSTGVKGHVQATSSFLTGTPLSRRASGPTVTRADMGVSLDQFTARHIGGETRIRSIELGLDPPRSGGENNLPISFANTVSWAENDTKIEPEINPQAAFDRLFGESRKTPLELDFERSLLDRVADDTQRLQKKASMADRRKLDEYLTAVRDVEKRIQESMKPRESAWKPLTEPELVRPGERLPESRDKHLRMMMDLLVLALWTDTTRVATLMMAHGFSRQNFTFIGVNSDHHSISHHKESPDLVADYTKVSCWYVEQFVYLVERMKAIDEGGASLLDNSIVLYGSGLKDGNGHTTKNLPVLLAGRGKGALNPGRRVVLPQDTHITSLHLTLAQKMGVKADRFNNNTGIVKNL